jgi:hypothetical protein
MLEGIPLKLAFMLSGAYTLGCIGLAIIWMLSGGVTAMCVDDLRDKERMLAIWKHASRRGDICLWFAAPGFAATLWFAWQVAIGR